MPFDYTIKGWLPNLTIGANIHAPVSCDKDDSGLVYAVANQANPHITIHNLNKEGPDDFVHGGGKKRGQQATGIGTVDQTNTADTIATAFRDAIDASMR